MSLRHFAVVVATIAVACGDTTPPSVAASENPCAINNGGCDPNAICEFSDGTPVCACKTGYLGDGITCARNNPCAVNNGGCDPNATCKLGNGTPVCSCNPGYAGDGFSCDDKAAPLLVFASPKEGSTFSLADSATVTVSGTVSATKLAQFAYRVDEGEGLDIAVEGGAFTFSFEVADEDFASHIITLAARDVSDRLTEATRTIVVDRLAPRIDVSSPAAGAVVSGESLLVEGSIVEADLQAATLRLDDEAAKNLELDGTSFRSTLPLPNEDSTPHRLTITAIDGLGNESSLEVSFIVDRMASISVTGLADQQVLGMSAPNPLVVAVRIDNASAASYTIDGSTPVPLSAGDNSLQIPLNEADDRVQHTFVVQATGSGGQSTSQTITYFVDRLAPRISIQGLVDGQAFAQAAPNPLEITGQIADAMLVSATYQIDSEGSIPVTLPSFAIDIPLDETDDHQPHTLVVEATDSAGNAARETLTFIVDRLAPTLSIENLSADQLLGGNVANPFVLTGQLGDAMLASATYQIDSEARVGFPPTSAFQIPIPLADSDDYLQHSIVVEVTDAAGNATSVSRSFFVDRVAPRVAIATPAVNASCGASVSVCTGPIINLASGASFRFAGTVEDAGLPETGGLSATVGSTPLILTGIADWTCDWSGFPDDNGASHTFSLTATDLAGNATSIDRIVWVDRVAPLLQSSANGSRLLARDATLATFSEQMDVSSVRAATSFSPSASTTNLASSDQRSFAFSSAATLSPYTIYSMQISPGARDRAGNPLAGAGTVLFLTEPVDPDLSSPSIATGAADPVLRTDPDGRPVLLYRTLSDTSIASKYWRGTTTSNSTGWDYVALPAPSGTVRAVPSDLAVSGTPLINLQLALTYKAVVKVETASEMGVYFAERQPSSAWALSQRLGLTSALGHPSLASGLFNGTTKEFIAYLHASAYRIVGNVRNGVSWAATSTLLNLTLPTLAMNQAGALDDDTLVYLPERASLSVGVDPSEGGVAVAGVQPVEVDGAPVGSAFLAYSATVTREFQGSRYTQPYLAIACSSTPRSPASWKSDTNTPLAILPWGCAFCSSSKRITGLSMAASDTKVAIAVEVDGNTVFFGSMDNGDCSAAPSNVTWDRAISSAKQPAVAVGRNGKIYKVFVAETSDTLTWAP